MRLLLERSPIDAIRTNVRRYASLWMLIAFLSAASLVSFALRLVIGR